MKAIVELDHSLNCLLPPNQLNDIENAAKIVSTAIEENTSILVVGDFDADGATACALVVSALRAMGVDSIDYLVPDRFKFGYGLSPEIVRFAARLKPELLITVDNGIASIEGVALANRLGMKVIVTDHH